MSLPSPGDLAPAIQVPAFTPGRRNARMTGPAEHRGRWVVLGFQPRAERTNPAFLDALADLGSLFGADRPVILTASTSIWIEQAWRHVDAHELEGRVDHILADGQMRLAAACGVLQGDGDCRRAAIVVDPDGVVRHVATGALEPVLRAA